MYICRRKKKAEQRRTERTIREIKDNETRDPHSPASPPQNTAALFIPHGRPLSAARGRMKKDRGRRRKRQRCERRSACLRVCVWCVCSWRGHCFLLLLLPLPFCFFLPSFSPSFLPSPFLTCIQFSFCLHSFIPHSSFIPRLHTLLTPIHHDPYKEQCNCHPGRHRCHPARSLSCPLQDRSPGQVLSKDRLTIRHSLSALISDLPLIFRECSSLICPRYSAYKTWEQTIAKEGGYEAFTRGYERFGFQISKSGITYREWAPNATKAFLFGEFSINNRVFDCLHSFFFVSCVPSYCFCFYVRIACLLAFFPNKMACVIS